MRKRILIIALCLFTLASVSVFAQMTDSQIVSYVKKKVAAGASEADIAKGLLAKGASLNQIQTLMDVYSNDSGKALPDTPQKDKKTTNRAETEKENPFRMDDPQDAYNRKKGLGLVEMDTTVVEVYGHDMFSQEGISFEPNLNIATPSNYVLGPGDQVVIDVWGSNEANVTETISPEGRIIISQIGPIYLSGLTIAEAEAKIKKSFASKYSTANVSVTLGNIRSIQVNVMGEVNAAGTYRLTSFSSIFHAIYKAGGVSEIGSLRDIRLVRGGETVKTVDMYSLLFNGIGEVDTRLEDGDVVIVPAAPAIVEVKGSVKRPMKYEILPSDSMEDLLEYAGGFNGDAYRELVQVIRYSTGQRSIYSVSQSDFASFSFWDGDEIVVDSALDRFENLVEVQGGVMRPGYYELGLDVATVRQLVAKAGGLKEDAFRGRALIIREKEDLTLESKSVNLGKLLNGEVEDVLLRKNDVLVILEEEKIREQKQFSIEGFVMKPGVYPYSDNTSIEDLILLAGGLKDGASLARVDVIRRLYDPKSSKPSNDVAVAYTYSINDGLELLGDESGFVLEPYDVVNVRRSPDFRDQKVVTIEGEVSFEGEYVLVSNSERLSSLINRAGGVTAFAYLDGARLMRQFSDEEIAVRENAIDASLNRVNKSVKDNNENEKESDVRFNTEKLSDLSEYSVGIDLKKALKNPYSEYDIVLRNGDRLIIPENPRTVKISGTVMYPNTVSYVPGKPVSYYINQAGGYGYRAKKNSSFVVYLNGSVSKVSMGTKVEPGCEIIVPEKGEKRAMSATEVVSIGASTASIATMIATLVNILK